MSAIKYKDPSTDEWITLPGIPGEQMTWDSMSEEDKAELAALAAESVDVSNCLATSGGTMTGDIDMGENKITSSYTPVDVNDLVNKGYIDTLDLNDSYKIYANLSEFMEGVTDTSDITIDDVFMAMEVKSILILSTSSTSLSFLHAPGSSFTGVGTITIVKSGNSWGTSHWQDAANWDLEYRGGFASNAHTGWRYLGHYDNFGLGTTAKNLGATPDADFLDTMKNGQTGWYMGSNLINAPGEGWFYYTVIAHNLDYATCEAVGFTTESGVRYTAELISGNFSGWKKVVTADDVAQVYSGTYTGTGVYGSSNQNTLALPFKAKALLIANNEYGLYAISTTGYWGGMINESTLASGEVTVADDSVSWYGTSTTSQFNRSGDVYSYIAIG